MCLSQAVDKGTLITSLERKLEGESAFTGSSGSSSGQTKKTGA